MTGRYHFDNNRTMEPEMTTEQKIPADLLTAGVLETLRALAAPDCVLCATESWDGEELD